MSRRHVPNLRATAPGVVILEAWDGKLRLRLQNHLAYAALRREHVTRSIYVDMQYVDMKFASALPIGNAPAKTAFPPASNVNQRDELLIRLFDIVFATAGLIFLAPIMLITAIVIYILDPGPIFFGHTRIGRDGKTFRCLKYRSMVVDAEARLQELLLSDPVAREEWERDHKLRNDPRIIGIGHFLRKSSIDELPQLFNVLRGEMSVVGPRPIVAAEVQRYGRYFRYYTSVRPGITGLWQISGRSDTSYRRRVALDVMYCRSPSLKVYMRILFGTVPSVLAQSGSY